MTFLTDPAALVAIARRIGGHADDLRRQGSRLVAAAEQVRWHSPAAGAFRSDVRGLGGAFRRAADGVDDAAAALRRHAESIRHAEAVIRAAERAAEGALHSSGSAGRSALDATARAGAALGHALGL